MVKAVKEIVDEQWWTWITSLNALPHLTLTYVAPSCWNCLLEMLLTQGLVFFDFWPRQFISTQLLWRPFFGRLEWRKSKSIQALMEKIYTLRPLGFKWCLKAWATYPFQARNVSTNRSSTSPLQPTKAVNQVADAQNVPLPVRPEKVEGWEPLPEGSWGRTKEGVTWTAGFDMIWSI